MSRPNRPSQTREYRRQYSRRPDRVLKAKESRLARKYGLTLAARDALIAGQGGGCAICGTANWPYPGPVVDHDHTTGAVRGVLCHHCNVGLGQFRDDPDRLAAAIAYLERPCPP